MEKINIKDLVKLVFLCISILTIAVIIGYLLASVIVYLKIDVFDFNWKEALFEAVRKGIIGGGILGFGIWIKAKLQERKNNRDTDQ